MSVRLFKTVAHSQSSISQTVFSELIGDAGLLSAAPILFWMETLGEICASKHCDSNVLVACIDKIEFGSQVKKGWAVTLNASVNLVSGSSVEVGIRGDTIDPNTGSRAHMLTAFITYVSVDSHGTPQLAPRLILENSEQERRNGEATKRREARLALCKKGIGYPEIADPALSYKRNSFNQVSLVTSRKVKAGEVVFALDIGEFFSTPNLRTIELAPDLHIDHPYGRYTNHSCEPTCYISKADRTVRASEDLDSGIEVTFDYLANESNISAEFDCLCGAISCKGKIGKK